MFQRKQVAAALALCACGLSAQAETLIGLTTTNMLVRFDSSTPTNAASPVLVQGLMGSNERLIGLDLRPATGALYGLSDAGRLYTLNSTTGMASFVAALMADPSDSSSPFTALAGTSFAVDFNPVPDLGQTAASLRVMSNSGQNLRINVNAAAAGRTTTDGMLNGATTRLDAVAYTNNDRNPATGTALFGIDASTDMLYRVGTPNNGDTIAVGSLGVDTSGVAGFDISGATGMAYAALTDGDTGKSMLYTIDLMTGAATALGAFGLQGSTAIAPPLLDITVAAVPEPETYALMLGGLALLGAARRRAQARS